MLSIQLKPDQILAEVSNFNLKLAEGIRTLRDVGDIPTGVTRKKSSIRKTSSRSIATSTPPQAAKNKTPLLICYALVNRPYMTDIQENRSTIRGLMEAGQDVYLIDWATPTARTVSSRSMTTSTVILIAASTSSVIVQVPPRSIFLASAKAACSACAMLSLHPEKVRNIITMVTMVDFPDRRQYAGRNGSARSMSTSLSTAWVMCRAT